MAAPQAQASIRNAGQVWTIHTTRLGVTATISEGDQCVVVPVLEWRMTIAPNEIVSATINLDLSRHPYDWGTQRLSISPRNHDGNDGLTIAGTLLEMTSVSCRGEHSASALMRIYPQQPERTVLTTVELGEEEFIQMRVLERQRCNWIAPSIRGRSLPGEAIEAIDGDLQLAARISAQLIQPKISLGCLGCRNYHGVTYEGNRLICGMHPYGWDQGDCPDWEGDAEPSSSPNLSIHSLEDLEAIEQIFADAVQDMGLRRSI